MLQLKSTKTYDIVVAAISMLHATVVAIVTFDVVIDAVAILLLMLLPHFY